MKVIFSLGIVRGALAGLAGVGAGIGITALVRFAMGLPVWNPDIVFVVGIVIGVLTYLAVIGVFDYWMKWVTGAPTQEETGPLKPSWQRYFSYDTNHKVIGVQYLVSALFFLPFAVSLQLAGRLQLTQLIPNLLNPSAYESVISDHGIVMLFIVVLPAFSGLMNYFVPLLIGCRDMAFPRLNAFTFWLVPPAGLLTVFSLAAGGFDTGWTVYAPLSASFEQVGMDLILLGVYFSGLSSILTGINIMTTIITMRAPGMNYFRLPVFIWSAMATVGLSMIFTQFVGISFLMVLLERTLGMGFFNPNMGGQVLLYQYLFWFYSHPAVYVFVLLGLGIISDIVPVFSRKPLFGYKGVAISSPGIAIGGSIVFAHHMFAAGISTNLRIIFMITTLLVAVPTGVKVFAWVATMWLGKLRMTTSFLFILSAIITFLIGGLTGIPLGVVPADLYLHDTYFVVGHFHATLFGGFLLPLMGAIYYWYPKVTGRMLSEGLGKRQWAAMTLGTAGLILPMLGLGLEGMRRRIAVYPLVYHLQPLHITIAVAGFLIFGGLVILIINIIHSFKHGAVAGNNPWDARTLEWQTTSPPPENNFVKIPLVLDRPHLQGVSGAVHAVTGDTGRTAQKD